MNIYHPVHLNMCLFYILRGSGSCLAGANVIALAPAVYLCKGRRVFVYKVPGFSVSDEEEEARVYLVAHGVWSAEAISKGSYRKVKTDAPQEHSAVKNPPRLKSMTAFRDLVGAQAFSFTPSHIKMSVRMLEGDKDRKLLTFQLLLKAAGLGAFGRQHFHLNEKRLDFFSVSILLSGLLPLD